MARLGKEIKNKLVNYVNDREKGKKAGQAIKEFYNINKDVLLTYQDNISEEEFIQKLYVAYRNEYFLKSVATQENKEVSLPSDKEKIRCELNQIMNKLNEISRWLETI